jgi:hypothetical protein
MLEEISKIKHEIQEYLQVQLDLIKLHTAENISRILSNTATIAVVGYLSFFILLFLSFAAGYFFGSKLHSNELGFLCVAGIYLLFLVIFLIFRRSIIERPVIKAIVRLFFIKFRDDEKE